MSRDRVNLRGQGTDWERVASPSGAKGQFSQWNVSRDKCCITSTARTHALQQVGTQLRHKNERKNHSSGLTCCKQTPVAGQYDFPRLLSTFPQRLGRPRTCLRTLCWISLCDVFDKAVEGLPLLPFEWRNFFFLPRNPIEILNHKVASGSKSPGPGWYTHRVASCAGYFLVKLLLLPHFFTISLSGFRKVVGRCGRCSVEFAAYLIIPHSVCAFFHSRF